MEAIPYVEALVKEFLAFRGFKNTLTAFQHDLASDAGAGFQVCTGMCSGLQLDQLDQGGTRVAECPLINPRALPGRRHSRPHLWHAHP